MQSQSGDESPSSASSADILQGLRAALADLPRLLRRGDATPAASSWLEQPTGARLAACIITIIIGGAAYGMALGLWRAPLMGAFVAVKLPLLIFLTLATNALLSGLLAQLMGSGLGFRQTFLALLMSFALFSLITGALAPVAALMAWQAPPPGTPGSQTAYQLILLLQTALIAYAGVVAHRRFLPLLVAASATPQAGRRVFAAWLAGNLFVGAQLSWNLRPFFGQPGRPVQFLRADWNAGTFYESIARNALGLLPSGPGSGLAVIVIILALTAGGVAWAVRPRTS